MEKNDLLRNLVISATIFLIVSLVFSRLMPSPPPPASPTMTPGSTTQTLAPLPSGGAPSQPVEGVAGTTPAPATGGFTVLEAPEVQLVDIGASPDDWENAKPRQQPYRSAITLTNVGAAIETAAAADHAETLGQPQRYRILSPVPTSDGQTLRSLAVERVNIDGTDVILLDKKWHVATIRKEPTSGGATEGEAGHAVEFTIDIAREGAPVLRLIRSYRLPPQPEGLMRHDLYTDLRIENLSDQPHQVILAYHGGVGIPTSDPRTDDRFVDAGIAVTETSVTGDRHAYASIIGRLGPQEVYRPSTETPQYRFTWAATANHYFTCTIAPQTPAGEDRPPYIAEVAVQDRDAQPETTQDIILRFVTVPATLAPNQSIAYPAEVYLGEKEFDGFRKVETYVHRNYYFQISSSYGSCTFSWLVELMIWLLNALHVVVRDFGVAIIILVLVVRTLLHPITKKGQVNMVRMQHRMQEMAPKIEEIKKKYANDRARMNQEMMKLDLNPAGQLFTCLPMLIQMPIWIGLWISLSNNILMRHEPFLFTWIRDLSAQDALYTFAAPLTIPLFGWKITSFNLLPFLLSITQYLQIKLQPKPKPNPNMTDEQRRQQEMMQSMTPIMVIMMFLIFYNAPSGLCLYVLASSFFGTIEQWRIRVHIREREAAGTLHKPLRERVIPATGDAAAAPALPAWVQRLQKMAEDAQKVKSQRQPKGRKR